LDNKIDTFRNLKAAATNNVLNAHAGTGASHTTSADSQPDAPRNLSVTVTNVASPSGNVVVAGKDPMGNSISESFTISPGSTVVGNSAFININASGITIPAGVSSSDTVSVGLGSKLGLLGTIYSDARDGTVYSVKKPDDQTDLTGYTLNTTYNTVAIDAGVATNDDFLIYWRQNKNIILE